LEASLLFEVSYIASKLQLQLGGEVACSNGLFAFFIHLSLHMHCLLNASATADPKVKADAVVKKCKMYLTAVHKAFGAGKAFALTHGSLEELLKV
jgi:hypothetical protein